MTVELLFGGWKLPLFQSLQIIDQNSLKYRSVVVIGCENKVINGKVFILAASQIYHLW